MSIITDFSDVAWHLRLLARLMSWFTCLLSVKTAETNARKPFGFFKPFAILPRAQHKLCVDMEYSFFQCKTLPTLAISRRKRADVYCTLTGVSLGSSLFCGGVLAVYTAS